MKICLHIPVKGLREAVLAALPDADLADAAAESSRTRSELALYERPDGDGAAEVEE